MSKEAQESENWNDDPMESPLIKHVVKHTISCNITGEHYGKLIEVTDDPGNYNSLKEALFYLENAAWNIGEARVQMEIDAIDRKGPHQDMDGNEVDSTAANPLLDRRNAKPGDMYDPDLCEIELKIGGQRQSFKYWKRTSIDKDNQDDIDDLNRWRHDIFRRHIGPQKFVTKNGVIFHPIEISYLMNRYANQEISAIGHVNFEDITKDYNAVFAGVNLPGHPHTTEARTRDSITGLLQRKAINPKEKPWPVHFSRVMKHNAAQQKIRREWQERIDANSEHNTDSNGDETEEEGDGDED